MKLLTLALAGYKAYAGRSPAAPNRALQQIELAPLTLIIGKNNAGKSCLTRAMHHVLAILADSTNETPFPIRYRQRTFANDFRAIQHSHVFFMPVDFELGIASGSLGNISLAFQLAPLDANATAAIVTDRSFGGVQIPDEHARGVLPDSRTAEALSHEARALLDASGYLDPVRNRIEPQYPIRPPTSRDIPTSSTMAAQFLQNDLELRSSVSAWMEDAMAGWRIDTPVTLDMFELQGRRTNLSEAGEGIQQVLPVVTLCRWRALGRGSAEFLDVIEQPELHLHDAAHAPLGDLLLEAVAQRGTMVVETHSEALVLRVRRRIAERKISPDRVALYYVEDVGEGATVRRIPIHDNGDVDWWPEGVFSEAFSEVMAIRRAQHARGKN